MKRIKLFTYEENKETENLSDSNNNEESKDEKNNENIMIKFQKKFNNMKKENE